MTITFIQKVIKVGSSNAVTIPAKEMKRLGVQTGDEIEVVFKSVQASPTLSKEYDDFVAQYGETLKNLSSR